MPTNNFIGFASAGSANIMSQADYAAAVEQSDGVQPGPASSKFANKVWRQGANMAAALGGLVADQGYNALDNGDIATLKAALKSAILPQSGTWTPVLNFIAPNTGDVTYLIQSGEYQRYGNLVYIYGTLSFKINVVPSNYVMMSGLPFVSNGDSRFSLAPNRWLRTQSGSTQTYIQKVRIDNGQLTEVFWSTSEGTTNYKVDVGDTITWTFSGWYRK